MISVTYGAFLSALLNKEIDYLSDTVKVLLCYDTYTPDQDADNYLNDVTTYEVSGGGYARQTLASKTQTYDSANNLLVLSCATPVFAALTAADVRYAVFFVDTGDAATSPLIGCWDFEVNEDPDDVDFSLVVSPNGLLSLYAG